MIVRVRRLGVSGCWLILCCAALGQAVLAQQVALTFDDLPAAGMLPPELGRVDIANRIIKTLQASHAPKSYGFVNAGKLQQNPADIEVLKLWRAAGFLLGNHTYSHMDLNANSADAFEQDIEANEPVLQSLMVGEDWRWFRYPFLWEGNTLEKRHAVRAYLQKHGYRIAQVTLDFEDYAWNDPYARCVATKNAEAIERLKATYLRTASEYIGLGQQMANLVYGRDIKHVMLLHLGGFETVMLQQLIDLVKQRGFNLVTLEQAESDPAYKSDPNLPLKYGGTLLEQMMVAKQLHTPPHSEKPFKELESICR
jgi:peptidoglycan-N-acetylglucosamine deacetylase